MHRFMHQIIARPTPASLEEILHGISGQVARWSAYRCRCGVAPTSAAELVADLRVLGVLWAALPTRHNGLGLGTEATGTDGLFRVMHLLGSGNLSAARLFEGHVNALQLICRYGTEAQTATMAVDAKSGHLFAIWNTEAPPGVRLRVDRLSGRKNHCSAAGIATRAVITVDQESGGRMLVVSLNPGERSGSMNGTLHGMRATGAGWVDFSDYRPDPAQWIGIAGDYLREPIFSAGAWRTLAGLLGGLVTLVEQIRTQLRERGRDGSANQRARVAEALIAQETAWLWVQKCGILAETGGYDPLDVTNYVNLARRAVEAACLAAIQLAQRSLGLAALVDTNPVEGLMRDLATYLRQPAMDEAIDQAAAHFIDRDLPRRHIG